MLSGLSPAGGVKREDWEAMSQLSQIVFDSKSWEDVVVFKFVD